MSGRDEFDNHVSPTLPRRFATNVAATVGVIASLLAIGYFLLDVFGTSSVEQRLERIEDLAVEDNEAFIELLATQTVPAEFVAQGRSTDGQGNSIILSSSVEVDGGWSTIPAVHKPGSTFSILATISADSAVELRNITLGAVVKGGVTYVAGTTEVTNSNHPEGIMIASDDLPNGGINIGDFAAGGYSYVKFDVSLADEASWNCGMSEADLTLVVKATSEATGDDLDIIVASPHLKIERICT